MTTIEKYRRLLLKYVSNTLSSGRYSNNFSEKAILEIINQLQEINSILELNIFDKIIFKKEIDGINCSFSLKTICQPTNFIRWQLFFGTPDNFKKEFVEAVCILLIKIEEKDAKNAKSKP